MPDIDQREVATAVAGIADRWPTVGLAVGVVRDGSLEDFSAHGLADIASGTPVTEDTVSRVASITKTITAVAVMQLWERGLVDLDATLRQLLTHTAGIRDVSLFVDVVGRGYPLLLMHGGPGADHWSMAPLRRCADRFTLVFYDHRCNGRSDGPPVSSMTWENLTANADALRERLGFERWAVLGHSFGGDVALALAGGMWRTKVRAEPLIYAGRELLDGWTVMDRLGEIAVPTLVMAGRDDFLFPPEHQVALASGLGDGRLRIIERAGHNAYEERPAEVAAAVRNSIRTEAATSVSGL